MNMSDEIKKGISEAAKVAYPEVGLEITSVTLEHPTSEDYGDYSTSVALQLAKKVGKAPQQIAEEIAKGLRAQKLFQTIAEKVEVAGPGFINITLKSEVLIEILNQIEERGENYGQGQALLGKKVMVEFGHPNTHKEMHIGHMRTLITGESLARIFTKSGALVFRANYQGDIGPHVAKAIWGTSKILEERKVSWEAAENLSHKEKAHLLGEGYILGNKEYDHHKSEIDSLNAKLYSHDLQVWPIYERTRLWSLDYYSDFYKRFYTSYDHFYFESEVASAGKVIVTENTPRIFTESEGAIIFDGEKYGLHTRVFITKDGNPTYEGKEMALAGLQFSDFPFDLNIHVVASEQAGYFQVVIQALEILDPKFVGREYHLSMGMVQLVGKKISSRTGVLITVDGLLDEVRDLLKPLVHSDLPQADKEKVLEVATIGAVKYSVLKSGPTLNSTFDLEKSVSLDGDSGPYLQYTYARAHSVLVNEKWVDSSYKDYVLNKTNSGVYKLGKEELGIVRYLYRFPEVVEQAARTYAPNLICSYMFELAKRYNNFYNNVPIWQAKSNSEKKFRIDLTEATSIVLKNGLNLLGIEVLERM